MNKELEALGRMLDTEKKVYGTWTPSVRELLAWDGEESKDLEIIEQALTPPTEEEVCKALSEHLEVPIYYNIPHRYFYYEVLEISGRNKKEIILTTFTKRGTNYNDETLDIRYDLPPHLIILIGRFYEGGSK